MAQDGTAPLPDESLSATPTRTRTQLAPRLMGCAWVHNTTSLEAASIDPFETSSANGTA